MEQKNNNRIYKKEVRLSKNEKDFIEDVVRKSGINFSAYTRNLYYKKEIVGAKFELANLGEKRVFQNLCNNFNQLVKEMHSTRQPIPEVANELNKVLRAIRDGYSKNL